MARRRSRRGTAEQGRARRFFSDWRRTAIFAVAVALVLALVVLLIVTLTNRPEPEEPPPNPVATITMSDGSRMRLVLYRAEAPNTVANFVKLANSGFYDGQQFFRIVSGVFIQAGDPNNNGTGDPGYAIKGEFADNGVKNEVSHSRGTISMARTSDYDSAGSQFFIMQGSYPEYDGRYAAFGRIEDEESLATLDAIAAEPVDSNYLPLTRQVIDTIRVETFDVDYEPETTARPQAAEAQ